MCSNALRLDESLSSTVYFFFTNKKNPIQLTIFLFFFFQVSFRFNVQNYFSGYRTEMYTTYLHITSDCKYIHLLASYKSQCYIRGLMCSWYNFSGVNKVRVSCKSKCIHDGRVYSNFDVSSSIWKSSYGMNISSSQLLP